MRPIDRSIRIVVRGDVDKASADDLAFAVRSPYEYMEVTNVLAGTSPWYPGLPVFQPPSRGLASTVVTC